MLKRYKHFNETFSQSSCQVRKKRPDSRLTLQYDKLYVDTAIYIFNDDTGQIELLNVAEIEAEYRSLVGLLCPLLLISILFSVSRERQELEEIQSESLQGEQRTEERREEVAQQVNLNW